MVEEKNKYLPSMVSDEAYANLDDLLPRRSNPESPSIQCEDGVVKPLDMDITIEEIDVLGGIACGEQTLFFSGGYSGFPFSASSGAGHRNSWILFQVGNRRFRMNAFTIMEDLLERVTGSRPETKTDEGGGQNDVDKEQV